MPYFLVCFRAQHWVPLLQKVFPDYQWYAFPHSHLVSSLALRSLLPSQSGTASHLVLPHQPCWQPNSNPKPVRTLCLDKCVFKARISLVSGSLGSMSLLAKSITLIKYDPSSMSVK